MSDPPSGDDWNVWRGAMTAKMDRLLERAGEDDARFEAVNGKIHVLDKKVVRLLAWGMAAIAAVSVIAPILVNHFVEGH
jgi:hypothetical protein